MLNARWSVFIYKIENSPSRDLSHVSSYPVGACVKDRENLVCVVQSWSWINLYEIPIRFQSCAVAIVVPDAEAKGIWPEKSDFQGSMPELCRDEVDRPCLANAAAQKWRGEGGGRDGAPRVPGPSPVLISTPSPPLLRRCLGLKFGQFCAVPGSSLQMIFLRNLSKLTGFSTTSSVPRQDVRRAIFQDMISKGKEAGLNSLEQVRKRPTKFGKV